MLRRHILAGFSSLVVAGAVMSATAHAQSAAPSIDKPVTITFYNYNLASAGIGAEATKKLIGEFMAANPNVKVEGVAVPAQDMASRLQSDMAAGKAPDVAQVIFDGLAFSADNLGAVTLEDTVPQNELADHFAGMIPAGIKLGQLGGKTYALAYTFSTPVLFYNADLFRKAGLDPDQPPKTWEQVKAAAVAIRGKTGAQGFNGALAGGGAAGFDWALQGLLQSNGGSVLSADRKTITFGEPAAVQAISMLRDLHETGAYQNMPNDVMIETMKSGQLGMVLNTSAQQNSLIKGAAGKFELRATQMPGFADRPSTPTNSGSGLMIFSQEPPKQRAAWELMKFLTSKRGYTVITSEIGYLPLRPDIVDDPQYLGEWVKQNPMVRPNLAQLERLHQWVAFPGQNYRQITKILLDATETAVFGKADVAETMKAAQAQAQGLVMN
ncbi:ABC transporter substrate-binding protein [Agrobacterium rhizogenes]|uniref:ABC transporter substrate-binding protein n=1 Tax=Rhizobium rhizogenes TaxID=359 RepID=UPI0022B6CF48|nr:ABC transporter substrate-binding protein [Rhizobium rhizogenes]MCZ7449281.1 ABC transporter substrate-binding protein [Rhizobium rhizogenes]